MPTDFDQAYKRTTDEEPRGTFVALAGIALPREAIIESLDRELSLEQLRVDHLYRVTMGDYACLHHFEALTHYRSNWGRSQLDHAVAAARKYRLDILSHLLLLQEKDTPKEIDPVISIQAGSLLQTLSVNVIRLWKRPAADVLHYGSVALYPWTALMKATAEQQREAARRIHESQRDGLRMDMALLGALRYGSTDAFFKRIGPMLLNKRILSASPLWKEIEVDARRDGLAEGLAEGLADGERRALRRILTRRFGSIPDWAEQKLSAADIDTLERWIDQSAVADSVTTSLD